MYIFATFHSMPRGRDSLKNMKRDRSTSLLCVHGYVEAKFLILVERSLIAQVCLPQGLSLLIYMRMGKLSLPLNLLNHVSSLDLDASGEHTYAARYEPLQWRKNSFVSPLWPLLLLKRRIIHPEQNLLQETLHELLHLASHSHLLFSVPLLNLRKDTNRLRDVLP